MKKVVQISLVLIAILLTIQEVKAIIVNSFSSTKNNSSLEKCLNSTHQTNQVKETNSHTSLESSASGTNTSLETSSFLTNEISSDSSIKTDSSLSSDTIKSCLENNITLTQSNEIISNDTPVSNAKTMNLLIISGHANLAIDPGAVYNGRYEFAYALSFVDELRTYINKNYPNINVILEDGPYEAKKEMEYIKKVKPDYALSIHFNAGMGNGFEMITPLKNKDLFFAINVVSLLKQLHLPLRPLPIYSKDSNNNKIARASNQTLVGSDYYGVIREGTNLGIISEILEIEFIDNDVAMNKYSEVKHLYVEAIAKSIDLYYQHVYA